MELFTSQGYDGTTVGDIAARAGVTKRTYNRHFLDKREVLFGGADQLRERIASSLRSSPGDVSAWQAGLLALGACVDLFDPSQHEQLRLRDELIRGSADLQEREARKLASIADVVSENLVARGADQHSARLVADLTVAVFKQAARLWMDDPATSFADHVNLASAHTQRLVAQVETARTRTARATSVTHHSGPES